MTTFADLMEPRPNPWGLRGDPKLLDAMKEVFAGHPLPNDVAELRTAYLTAFETLTGVSLMDAPARISVAWTKGNKGGLSNGFVSRKYWRDMMLPAMIRRFHEEQKT